MIILYFTRDFPYPEIYGASQATEHYFLIINCEAGQLEKIIYALLDKAPLIPGQGIVFQGQMDEKQIIAKFKETPGSTHDDVRQLTDSIEKIRANQTQNDILFRTITHN